MRMAATSGSLPNVTLLGLAGPIFAKEWRIAGRQAWRYGLRSGYILFLTVIVISAWTWAIRARAGGGAALGLSRLSELGTYVTLRIVSVQFLAAQLVAALMLGSAVSGEMRRGTLGVLLTTPISGLHIAAGKWFSGLLQVVPILAISLPILAILRVLGGVPWAFVAAGLCITVTACAFAGALGLLLSTYCSRPFGAISAVATVYLVVFAALPAAVVLVSGGIPLPVSVQSALDLSNPFLALHRAELQLLAPPGGPVRFPWPAHCLIMLSATTLLVGASAWRMRRTGLAPLLAREGESMPAASSWRSRPPVDRGFRSTFHLLRIDLALGLVALVGCALLFADVYGSGGKYGIYVYFISQGLVMVGLLRLAMAAAGGIASEKESGTWPILLTTPLDDKQILCRKAVGALRRTAGLLLAATALEVCFLLSQSSSPKALSIGLGVFSVVASVFYITAAGLYFGVRLRRTTTAVAATLGSYLCLNYIVCGYYNPLFGWLIWKMAYNTGAQGVGLMLLGFGMGAATFVADSAVGMLLLRRAWKGVRLHVF